MKTSIATATIAGDLREKLSAIAAAGFNGIEIFDQDFIGFEGTLADFRHLVRDHGLTIDLFQPVYDFEGLPEPLRTRAFDQVERKFDLMIDIGCELLPISSTTHEDSIGGIDCIAEDFLELANRAAARGLRVGYEARAWGRHVNDYRDAWKVVRKVDHDAVGLILDSFHTLARGSELEPIGSISGDKIFHVQLADAPMIDMDLEYWSRNFRTTLGEGDLLLVDFMAAVAETGYGGPLSLEIQNNIFLNRNPKIMAVSGQRSLVYLMDRVAQTLPDITPKLAPPSMPPRVKVNGVEFVEFTAGDKDVEPLGTMLSMLGFVPMAHHISKDVTLWRQGEINLVVNCEKEGFARSAYIMHGLSVCDIGLMVEDSAAAVERAKILGASLFYQKRGGSELDIPAVRGVGGSVLHFLDKHSELAEVWETEFTRNSSDYAALPVGLTRIDHVGQVTSYEDMQTWTLFYEAIFKLDKLPLVDVADPSGIVHSRAIQSKDGGFRLNLNGADTHRTLAGRFLADSFGSPVQHLAFACGDLLDTADRLAENGFQALPIPDNYYVDLATRFDLDDTFLGRLKAANILYHEDGQGSYMQLYSRPQGDGFFFEIVERRDEYDGYGAPNAPHRTAALKHFSRNAGMPRR